MSTNALLTSPPRPAVPDQLIVVWDHTELVQTIREIARGNFTVLVDRRHAERRRRMQPVLEERRQGERRTRLAIAATSRFWHLCWSASATAHRSTDCRAPGAD